MLTTASAQVMASLAQLKAQGAVAEYTMQQDGPTTGLVVRMADGRTSGIAWDASKPVKEVLRSVRKQLERF